MLNIFIYVLVVGAVVLLMSPICFYRHWLWYGHHISCFATEKALAMLNFIESVSLGENEREWICLNQENVAVVLTFITPRIIQLLMHNLHITAEAAFILLYNSRLYNLLEEEKTKLWHLSYSILYDMLEEELTKGTMIWLLSKTKSCSWDFVWRFTRLKKMSGQDVFNYLYHTGAIDFIKDCYEGLHTTGHLYIIGSIDEYIMTHSENQPTPEETHSWYTHRCETLYPYIHSDRSYSKIGRI